MASLTANYGFVTGVVTDDVVESVHHNRIADTVDRVMGEALQHLVPAGVHEGWEITADKEVTPGEGLVAGCWCHTSSAQRISGVVNGTTNSVYAVAIESSAPTGAVAFVAETTPPGPGKAVFLGTLTLDAEGNVTGVDNRAAGVQRNCHRIEIGRLEGSGVLESVPGGGTVGVTVDHSAMGSFRVPGDLQVRSENSGFTWAVVEHHRGDRFRLEVTNTESQSRDFAYVWEREGLVR